VSEEEKRKKSKWARGKATISPSAATELRKVCGFLQVYTGRNWGISKTVKYLIEVWKRYEYPELSRKKTPEVLATFLGGKGEEEGEGTPEG